MVAPHEALDAVRRSVEESGLLPERTSYLTHEADLENEDAYVDLPLVQVQPLTSARVNPANTDFVGWTTDDSDNRTGRVYHAEYQLTVQIDIWTAAGAGADPNELGEKVREALYEYSSYGLEKKFRDEDGNPLDEIWRFTLGDGERADDLLRTPTVRRWRQDAEIWGYEEFKTTEDYIVDVNYPTHSAPADSDNDDVIEVEH